MSRQYEVSGIGVVNVTPVTPTREVNEEELRRHVAHLADQGIAFLQPGAATGQGLSFSESGYRRVLEICVEEVGSVCSLPPIQVGTRPKKRSD